MAIKYIRQDRSTNCGPTAIYNLLLWAGHKPKHLDIFGIEYALMCDMTWGTHKYRITSLLKALKFKFTEKRRAKNKDIEKALREGKSIICCYMFTKHCGHYIFIHGQTKKCFLVANPDGGNLPMRRISKKYYALCAQKYSKHYRDRFWGVYPHIWAIKK